MTVPVHPDIPSTQTYTPQVFSRISGDAPERRNEVADALRFWYRHPDWQAMLLCPWLRLEETFRLADVYTRLEMESLVSRQTKPLKAYTDLFDLFNTSKTEGYRIMVQGQPGIGKTTFTHKMALDWADGELGVFDIVFVIQLRDMKPGEAVPKAVLHQMKTPEDIRISAGSINMNLVDPELRVLLVLDGLDEVDLEHHPQLRRILSGEELSSCCVLVTSRPHVAPAVKNEMNCVARITGFSQRSAEAYVAHIITDPDVRKLFFKQMSDRKMQGMVKVPIILQALALLFSDGSKLPDTYTLTYDELVLYLQKTCEAIKGLSPEQIQEAMKVVGELAFLGLTDPTQQRLVFSRDEISNEDVFKLGLLSATKTVTGFKPTATVQFPHKTVQEYSTSGHVARELVAGNREPWEALKTMYSNQFKGDADVSSLREGRRKRPKLEAQLSTTTTEDRRAVIINSAAQKFLAAMRRTEGGKDEGLRLMFKTVLEKGFLDDEPDIALLWKTTQTYPATQDFTEEEKRVTFDFVLELLDMFDLEQKKKTREWFARGNMDTEVTMKNYGVMMVMVCSWMNRNPAGALDLLTGVFQKLLSSGDLITFQAVTENYQWLQEQTNSMKILLRFLMGKLQPHPDLARQILREIAEMLVAHAFHPGSGEAISVYPLKSYITDLMNEAKIPLSSATEALYSSEGCTTQGKVPTPVIVNLKGPIGDVFVPSRNGPNALKLEDVSGNLTPVVELVRHMQNLTVFELQNIPTGVLEPEEFETLAETLASAGTVLSVFMDVIDDVSIANAVVRNLPASARKLTMLHIPPEIDFRFPAEVGLRSLFIDSAVARLGPMFQSQFPNLSTLSLACSRLKWSEEEVGSLHEAVSQGHMPLLENICIRFGDLGGHGSKILDIIQKPTIRTVDLMDTSLTKSDGQLLLAALDAGKLNHVQSLNLLHNPGLNDLVPEVQAAANRWQIGVQSSPSTAAGPALPWWYYMIEGAYSLFSRCTIL